MFDFLKKLFLPITATLDFITKYFKTIVFLTILYFIFFNAPNEEGIKTGQEFTYARTLDQILAAIQ